MSMIPELNKVYICKKLGAKVLNKKTFNGYTYKLNDVVMNGTVNRYALDVEKGKTVYTAMVLTKSNNDSAVSEFLNKTSDKVTIKAAKELTSKLDNLDIEYTGD